MWNYLDTNPLQLYLKNRNIMEVECALELSRTSYSAYCLCIFVLWIHRDQGWSLSTVKNIFTPPPVVYATDRSKAVVPVLFLILCSFVVYTTGRLMFKSLLVLFVLVSPFVLAFWSPRLGKKELVFVLLVHLFVCFARVCFCPFSLPLGVEVWLRFVIVAYPGPFY